MEEIVRLVAKIERSETLEMAQDLVRIFVQPWGYDRFVLYCATPTREGLIDHLLWVEGDWFGDGAVIDKEIYLRRCPITQHSLTTDEAFFWTKSGRPGEETYRVVPVPRGGGVHGLQVPVFGQKGLKGAMSFGGKKIESTLAVKLALTLIATACLKTAKNLDLTKIAETRNQLSKREREILQWVASGHRQNDIARTLGLSERTIENHLRRVRHRLGVPTTAGAVKTAINGGEI